MRREQVLAVLLAAATVAYAAYDDTLSRDVFFKIALTARAPFTEVCMSNLLPPTWRLDSPFVVPCNTTTADSPVLTPNTTCKAVILINDNERIVAISFRGTVGAEQLKNENNVTTVPFMGNTNVLSYFYFGYRTLMDFGLRRRISELQTDPTYTTYKYYITGHSLGAAMASLLATELKFLNQSFMFTYITYGEPRVGDPNYALLFNRTVLDPYRVTHAEDPVPHLPPMCIYIFNTCNLPYFNHGGNEIWFNNSMVPGSTSSLCTADTEQTFDNPNCSNSQELYILSVMLNKTADPNVVNKLLTFHDTYYNYSMTAFVNNNCTNTTTTPTPISSTSNPNPTCPPGWNITAFAPKSCYMYVQQPNTWYAALETCEAYGASLASIDSGIQNSYVYTNAQLYTSTCQLFYIGLFKNGSTWQWVNGDQAGYNNWKRGDPNTEPKDICALMVTNDGTWENQDCAIHNCYICEKPAS